MNRKITYLFCFITFITSIVTSGCSDNYEEQNGSEESKETELYERDGFASALSVIENFKKKLNSIDPQLRSTPEEMIVESVEKKTLTFDLENIEQNVKLRSTPTKDTVDLFTITFKHGDKKGYSIVTGDERLQQIYAYVESGQLSDTTYNVGLAMTLAAIPDAVGEDIEEYYEQQSELKAADICNALQIWPPAIPSGLGPNPTIPKPSALMVTEWTQYPPYNLYSDSLPKNCTGNNQSLLGRCPAGCVTIGVAQVLACIATKNKTSSKVISYDLLKLRQMQTVDVKDTLYAKKVGIFVDSVGRGCKTMYGCDSSSDFPRVYSYLKNKWGLDVSYEPGQIDWKKVLTSLRKECPVLMGGQKKDKAGHTWVIDAGMFEWKSCIFGNYENTTYFNAKQVHCNWGWGPYNSNGWFASNVYNNAKPGKEYVYSPEALYINKFDDFAK